MHMSKELLVFSAPWCSHCVSFKPRIEEFEAAHKDEIKVTYINIDEDMDIARTYKIQSIPAVVLLKDGEKAGKHVGEMTLDELTEFAK